ncbi:histidine phosphatase family protein [Marinobacterium nitratireducens]|uniref:Histidine phosphatase family protein n=1 Tax=Marinobacterium nitratireducens TaxID=518897 RepID=A0A917ZL67_9GAMM|nr:histidine phosphatase family protein [Marinobacterium nitratireducens]GGO85319.1 histidine phosphatase family protein [Marinobacterium nitratireducens]
MAELYLIRHGQASFGGDDYDQLSTLGYRQCRWLGEYFRTREITFERIICGQMARHRQSADAICQSLDAAPAYETHHGFNEFDFEKLLLGYCQTFPEYAISDWQSPQDVYRCLRHAMRSWSRGELPDSAVPESWQAFEQRVNRALDFARRDATGNTLVCSSGGPISMALSQLMGFGADTLISTNLQMRNSSITHCFYTPARTTVTGFNSVPHLDSPYSLELITYS